jgi:exopolysaccharide biosynthesis polyprenyl glycosylphosphotransferase
VVRGGFARHHTDRVIFVGDPRGKAENRAAREVLKRPGVHSLGWLSEERDVQDYLGHPSAVWEVLCEKGTDTVVLCGNLSRALFDTVVEAAAVAGCRVLSVRNRGTLMATQPRALNGGPIRMLELTFPAARVGQDVVKRAFDVILASALLGIFAPVWLVMSLWIKLDSPGPVLFLQERVGRAGRVFRMLKFRTMRDGADSEKSDLAHMNHTGDPRLFKIPDDPRVTRAGAVLRRWSLDELPQLVNVLMGDMSLVGPRPFFESDLAAYDDHHFLRLAVKPGVTGLWQVRGRSSIVDFEEVVRLDREYIEHWTLLLDFRILAATIPAVFRRTGAY